MYRREVVHTHSFFSDQDTVHYFQPLCGAPLLRVPAPLLGVDASLHELSIHLGKTAGVPMATASSPFGRSLHMMENDDDDDVDDEDDDDEQLTFFLLLPPCAQPYRIVYRVYRIEYIVC